MPDCSLYSTEPAKGSLGKTVVWFGLTGEEGKTLEIVVCIDSIT